LDFILVCALAESGGIEEALGLAKQEREALGGGDDEDLWSFFEKAIGNIEAGQAVDVSDFRVTR
jgi:hypothetical protein